MRHNIQNWQQEDWNRRRMRHMRNHKGDKIWFGVVVALLGVFLFMKQLNLPYFNFGTLWPIGLIVLGLLIGIKKRFHNHAWWILILIGSAHLIPEQTIWGASSSDLFWPFMLIIGGVMIALKSNNHRKGWHERMQVVTSSENTLNIDVTFGGRKEIVTSKDFKGGNVNTSFGGVEINMVQADSTTQPMVLNLKVSFGGIELIVPSHWEIQNEIDTTLASVEDHRHIRTATATTEEKKVLVLKGNCSFGSIEIKSY
ncbi:MAG: hypothetical protein JST82_03210 [Bacteroidetes bacterium]|nr:hypothetical protein [Bacteroidota bacterium]